MSNNTILASMAVKLSAIDSDFQRAFKRSERTLGAFTKSVGAVNSQLKTLVAGFGAIEIGRQILTTTSQFQKFAAVLSNTLGSESEAQKALERIKDFAAETPFEVEEITAAYVRWANQGLSPTIDRMRKLGDVASSLGAGFEQTAEAFKDLLVGQTKRIEEIGISAAQSNGKIQLSFKGVNIEIDKSAEGVQKALDVYSQLNGVLGTSDAVSLTLGGRISNLNDAWTQLMGTLGESNSGVLYGTVQALTNITKALTNMGAEMALIGQALSPFHDLRDVSKETLDYLLKTADVSKVIGPLDKQDFNQFYTDLNKNFQTFRDAFLEQGESIEDINVLWDRYVQKRVASADADRKAQEASEKANAAAKRAAEEAERQVKASLERTKIGGSGLRKTVTNKTGADFLFDSGALTEMANAGANALRTLDDALEVNSTSWDIWWSGVNARAQQVAEIMEAHQERTSRLAEVSQTVGVAMGEAFSSLATGQENLLQAMARATEQIISMFLQQSIAGMIAAAMKDPSTPFPFAKIAIAAAGVAAVKGLFSSLGGNGGGGSGGRSSAPGRTPSEVGVKVGGRIRGYDLQLVNDKESYRRSRLG